MSRRAATVLALCSVVAGSLAAVRPAAAQMIPNITEPIKKAHAAADSTNSHMSQVTGQALPARQGAAPPKKSGPGSAPAAGQPSATATATAAGPSTAMADALRPVTREIFEYEPDNRRDPFFSLILTEDLRPLLSDLKLVGIVYDPSGRRSVAIMRDVLTNAQYRVGVGMTLGRMRVSQIKSRAVIFTIDELGLSRQDSLFMVDSTKVRGR